MLAYLDYFFLKEKLCTFDEFLPIFWYIPLQSHALVEQVLPKIPDDLLPSPHRKTR